MDTLRIGDAEREAAVAALGEQYALGRLSKEEYDERSDAAWSARTGADLSPLFADLPAQSPAPGRPTSAVRQRGAAPRRPWFPIPLEPVLVVLGVLTVLTHLPFVLLAVGLWFLASRARQTRGSRRAIRGSCS